MAANSVTYQLFKQHFRVCSPTSVSIVKKGGMPNNADNCFDLLPDEIMRKIFVQIPWSLLSENYVVSRLFKYIINDVIENHIKAKTIEATIAVIKQCSIEKNPYLYQIFINKPFSNVFLWMGRGYIDVYLEFTQYICDISDKLLNYANANRDNEFFELFTDFIKSANKKSTACFVLPHDRSNCEFILNLKADSTKRKTFEFNTPYIKELEAMFTNKFKSSIDDKVIVDEIEEIIKQAKKTIATRNAAYFEITMDLATTLENMSKAITELSPEFIDYDCVAYDVDSKVIVKKKFSSIPETFPGSKILNQDKINAAHAELFMQQIIDNAATASIASAATVATVATASTSLPANTASLSQAQHVQQPLEKLTFTHNEVNLLMEKYVNNPRALLEEIHALEQYPPVQLELALQSRFQHQQQQQPGGSKYVATSCRVQYGNRNNCIVYIGNKKKKYIKQNGKFIELKRVKTSR